MHLHDNPPVEAARKPPLEARSPDPYTGNMHAHVHGAGGTTRVLKISLGVTLAYIVLLVVAGLRSHSLALLSEAGAGECGFFSRSIGIYFV
jgi:hypothetical protein